VFIERIKGLESEEKCDAFENEKENSSAWKESGKQSVLRVVGAPEGNKAKQNG
jgi:hypothetical protein